MFYTLHQTVKLTHHPPLTAKLILFRYKLVQSHLQLKLSSTFAVPLLQSPSKHNFELYPQLWAMKLFVIVLLGTSLLHFDFAVMSHFLYTMLLHSRTNMLGFLSMLLLFLITIYLFVFFQDPAGIFELVEVVGNGTYGQVYKVSTAVMRCCTL